MVVKNMHITIIVLVGVKLLAAACEEITNFIDSDYYEEPSSGMFEQQDGNRTAPQPSAIVSGRNRPSHRIGK